MSKKHRAKKTVQIPQEDLSDDDDDWLMDDVTVTAIRGLIASARFDADIALNLTALLVENSEPGAFSKEDVLALYRDSLAVASESSPLKQVMEMLSDR